MLQSAFCTDIRTAEYQQERSTAAINIEKTLTREETHFRHECETEESNLSSQVVALLLILCSGFPAPPNEELKYTD